MAEQGRRTTRFALIPEWVLYSGLSSQAIHLYVVIDRHTDKDGIAWPSVKRLTEIIHCSDRTVIRGLAELEEHGAVVKQRRGRSGGGRASNLYYLPRDPPGSNTTNLSSKRDKNEHAIEEGEPRNEIDTPSGVSMGAALTTSIPGKVDRKPVKQSEGLLALDVLAEWNAQTGQKLRSSGWLSKIIMRIREYPELGAVDHAHLIAVTLAHPWWQGAVAPGVLYGSDTQFEKAVMAASGRTGPGEQSLTEKLFAHAERLRQEGR